MDYQYWKSRGICPYCKKEKVMPNKMYCFDCSKKISERARKNYQYYKKVGICTKCKKEKSMPNKTICEDCSEKKRKYDKKRSDERKRNPEKRAEHNAKKRQYYWDRKAAGMCTRCGSKPAKYGTVCYECYIKRLRRDRETCERQKRERHERGLISEIRRQNGECLQCGVSLSDTDKEQEYKLCQECRIRIAEYAKKGAENNPFRKGNRLIFIPKVRREESYYSNI